MITITWVIEWMNTSTAEINGYTKTVVDCGWRCNATDETYNGSNYGSCNFPQPTIDDAYIPYADLTKEQVLNWCWNNGVDKNTIEKNVTAQIESQINPSIIKLSLPWSN